MYASPASSGITQDALPALPSAGQSDALEAPRAHLGQRVEAAEEEAQALYTWVDGIPLSRPKRNIARDFSDGVLMAEVLAHFYPKLVQLHNYSSANGLQQKLGNWGTLNSRVLRRLGISLSRTDMAALAAAQLGAIERTLQAVKVQVEAVAGAGGGLRAVGERQLTTTSTGAAIAADACSGQAGMHTACTVACCRTGGWGSVPARAPRTGDGGGNQVTAGVLQGLVAPASADALVDKERVIGELGEANEILETKVRKLEQLVKLKDAKIAALTSKLQVAGLV